MLLSTIKLYLVLNFLVFGSFLFFWHTKFEITLRRLLQKKFCEQFKKKVWERIFIFRNLTLIFAGILHFNQVFW
jgi:hypothetical protein